MNIKQIHAHFLISIGNYSNERIGFSVELEEGETPEQVVSDLREKAKAIVGRPAQELYDETFRIQSAIQVLESKLKELRAEWDATAEFLRAQGVNPNAPKMPVFSKLLAAANTEAEYVTSGEIVDDDAIF